MHPEVVAVGECSLDHVCTVDGLPPFAGKAAMLDYRRLPGGQVATAALAWARLGLRVAFVGATGDDEAGAAALASLGEAGVDLSGVRREPGAPTRLAVILVDRASGERTVLWYRDPRLALRDADLPHARIAKARLLHLDGSDPAVALAAARAARAAGVPVMLDADRLAPGLEALLAEVDFPIVSRAFAEDLSRTGSVREGLDRLVGLGARLAVVTLGAGGALARDGRREIRSPGFAVRARDTTGAGDVFHAGFGWALLQGLEPEQGLRVANAAAALACLGPGAQGGLPTRDDLEAFLGGHEPGPWRDPEAPA